MAYLVDRKFKAHSSVTAIDWPEITHQANDIIVCWGSDPQTFSWPDPSTTGSFARGASVGTGVSVAFYWVRAAGAGTTMPTVTGMTSGDHITCTEIWRGCATTGDPFYASPDLITGTTGATNEHSVGSITTNDANVVTEICYVDDDWVGAMFAPHDTAGAETRVSNVAQFAQTTGSTYVGTMLLGQMAYPDASTVTDDFSVQSYSSAGWKAWIVVAWKDDGSTGIPAYPGQSPYTLLDPMGFGGSYPTNNGGTNDDSTRIGAAWTDGQSYAYKAYAQNTNPSPLGRKDALQIYTNNVSYQGDVGGATYEIDEKDASGKMIVGHFSTPFYSGMTPVRADAGGFYFGFRCDEATADSYRIWQCLGSDTVPPAPIGPMPIVIDLTDSGYVHSVGTFDASAIDGIFTGVSRDISESKIEISSVYILETMVLSGGCSSSPATSADFVTQSADYDCLTVQQLGDGQYQTFQSLTIGGTGDVYFVDDGDSMTFPTINRQFIASANSLTYKYDLTSGSTCNHTNGSIGGGSEQNLVFDVDSSATFSVSGKVYTNLDVTVTSIPTDGLSGVTFRGCTQFPAAFDATGVTIDNSKDATGAIVIDFASIADLNTAFATLSSSTWSNNTIALRLNYTGTSNLTGTTNDLPTGMTASGNTKDVQLDDNTYDVALTIGVPSGSGWSTTGTEGGGTSSVTLSAPTFDLDVTVNVSATIRVFTTATQTELTSTTGATLNWTHGDQTVDVTVWKAGYQQQRFTGIALSGVNYTLNVDLVDVPAYNASHGLAYTTDITYNRSTKEFDPVTRQTGADLYSALVDEFDNTTALHNTDFPIRMDGPVTAIFLDDAFIKVASLDNWYGCGYEYRDTSDVVQKQAASFTSTGGTWSGATAEYQTTAGTGQTDARTTGKIDETIIIYTNGGSDLRSAWVWKYQVNGYKEARADIVDLFGTLTATEYVFNMAETAIEAATGDPGITAPTFTDHAGTPVTWNSKDFSYTLQSSASGEDLLRELNYFMSLDATWEGESPFNRHNMILEVVAGTSYETQRGVHEGGTGAALKGVRVLNGSGDAHPDFTRFQADDGTYYVPPVTASISGSGMPTAAGAATRLQICNVTAQSASAWATGTAYSLGDKVLRSTGVGTENTAGLYMVCTTAGTSHASVEPTWDTVVGNTTADNTVTWTTYAVLYYDGDPASDTYSSTYTEGEEFASGDSVRVRFAEEDGGTTFKTYDTTLTTASTGFSFTVAVTADSVYATNALDGAAQTHFTADTTNAEIELNADTDFTAPQAYAFYCNTLTTSGGMHIFWDGVEAVDAGNYKIVTGTLNLYFNETVGAFVKQTDTARIFRDDGVRPAQDPTTGGYGIEINWKSPVYTISTGSVLTAGEKASLAAIEADTNELQSDDVPALIAALDAVVDTVKAETALIVADTNELQTDWTDGGRLDLLLDAVNTTTPPTAAAVADAVWDEPLADHGTSTTFGKAVRVAGAGAGGGKVSGAGTGTETFRNLADDDNEFIVTVDEDGNRTAVTL